MVYLGPKLCVTGIGPAGHLERQEPVVQKRELTVDHDEKHKAQKKEEDETAIESVVKAEENIKDVSKRIVFEIPDPELKPKAKLLKEPKSKEGLDAYSPRRHGLLWMGSSTIAISIEATCNLCLHKSEFFQ